MFVKHKIIFLNSNVKTLNINLKLTIKNGFKHREIQIQRKKKTEERL